MTNKEYEGIIRHLVAQLDQAHTKQIETDALLRQAQRTIQDLTADLEKCNAMKALTDHHTIKALTDEREGLRK